MKIENCVKSLENQMEIDKNYFFENPEPGLKEFKTSEYIIKRLKQIIAKRAVITTKILTAVKTLSLYKYFYAQMSRIYLLYLIFLSDF